jgi:hypothetical protein
MSDDGKSANTSDTPRTWTLSYGVHAGTITSRDTNAEHGLSDLAACRAALLAKERFFKSIGYVIWYARAIAPDSTEHVIHPGNNCYR